MKGLSWRKLAKHRKRLDNRKWREAKENPAPVRRLDADELATLEVELLAREEAQIARALVNLHP